MNCKKSENCMIISILKTLLESIIRFTDTNFCLIFVYMCYQIVKKNKIHTRFFSLASGPDHRIDKWEKCLRPGFLKGPVKLSILKRFVNYFSFGQMYKINKKTKIYCFLYAIVNSKILKKCVGEGPVRRKCLGFQSGLIRPCLPSRMYR